MIRVYLGLLVEFHFFDFAALLFGFSQTLHGAASRGVSLCSMKHGFGKLNFWPLHSRSASGGAPAQAQLKAIANEPREGNVVQAKVASHARHALSRDRRSTPLSALGSSKVWAEMGPPPRLMSLKRFDATIRMDLLPD